MKQDPRPANWDELNKRRSELIERKYCNGGLYLEEEVELEKLQELAGKVRDFFTPELPAELLEKRLQVFQKRNARAYGVGQRTSNELW